MSGSISSANAINTGSMMCGAGAYLAPKAKNAVALCNYMRVGFS